jgi:CubicO group peptidase (beta-lactamase class C family)
VTGRAYLDIIKDTIAKPIGLKNTGFDTPNMSDSIVPRGTPWFGFDVGNFRQYVIRHSFNTRRMLIVVLQDGWYLFDN